MTKINYTMWIPDVKSEPFTIPKSFRRKKVGKTFSPISQTGRRVLGEATKTTEKGRAGKKEDDVGTNYFKFVKSLKEGIAEHYRSARSRLVRALPDLPSVPRASVSAAANSFNVKLGDPVVTSNPSSSTVMTSGGSGICGIPMNENDMFNGGILPSNSIFSRPVVPDNVQPNYQMPGWLRNTSDELIVNLPSPQSPTNAHTAPDNSVTGVMPGWLSVTPVVTSNPSSSTAITSGDSEMSGIPTNENDIFIGGILPSNSIFSRLVVPEDIQPNYQMPGWLNDTPVDELVVNFPSPQSPTTAHIALDNSVTGVMPGWLSVTPNDHGPTDVVIAHSGNSGTGVGDKYQDDIFTGGVLPSNSIFCRNSGSSDSSLSNGRMTGWLDASDAIVKAEDVDITLAFSPSSSDSGSSGNSFSSSSDSLSQYDTRYESFLSIGTDDDNDFNFSPQDASILGQRRCSSSSSSSGSFGNASSPSRGSPSRYVTPNETFSAFKTQGNNTAFDSTSMDSPANVNQNDSHNRPPVMSPRHESSPGDHSAHVPVHAPGSLARAPTRQPYFNQDFRHHPPVQGPFPNHNPQPPGQGYDPHHPYFEHRFQQFFQPQFYPQPPVYTGHPPHQEYSPHHPYWHVYPAVQRPTYYPPQPPHVYGAFGGAYWP